MIDVRLDPVSVQNFSSYLNRVIVTSKRDMRDVIKQQAKLLAIQCMHYTPPWAGGQIPGFDEGNKGSTVADKKAGQEAVKRDILKTMLSKTELFSDGFQDKWLEKIVRKKDKEKLQKYFENVKSEKLKKFKVADFSEELHTSRRKYGGRFRPRPQNKFVFEEKKLKDYIRKVQVRVGQMKAGWAVSAIKFGGSVPTWVAAALPIAKGSGTEMESGDNSYSITISNWTPTIGRFSSAYSIALNIRANAMQRMYEDYLKKNVKAAFRT